MQKCFYHFLYGSIILFMVSISIGFADSKINLGGGWTIYPKQTLSIPLHQLIPNVQFDIACKVVPAQTATLHLSMSGTSKSFYTIRGLTHYIISQSGFNTAFTSEGDWFKVLAFSDGSPANVSLNILNLDDRAVIRVEKCFANPNLEIWVYP